MMPEGRLKGRESSRQGLGFPAGCAGLSANRAMRIGVLSTLGWEGRPPNCTSWVSPRSSHAEWKGHQARSQEPQVPARTPGRLAGRPWAPARDLGRYIRKERIGQLSLRELPGSDSVTQPASLLLLPHFSPASQPSSPSLSDIHAPRDPQ